jgi:hypothetical protein
MALSIKFPSSRRQAKLQFHLFDGMVRSQWRFGGSCAAKNVVVPVQQAANPSTHMSKEKRNISPAHSVGM